MLYFIKFVYSFLLPPGIFILLFLAISVFTFRKSKILSILLFGMSLMLYLVSIPFVSNVLMRSLEGYYHPPQIEELTGDVIVMLGGGATPDTPDVDGLGQLSGSAANRLLTTARLQRNTSLPVIISGGKVYSDSGLEAEIAKRQLMSLGVPAAKIFVEHQSLNTNENAKFTGVILKEHDFHSPILVTSAFHMNRSVKHFANRGIIVQPYPTDYWASCKGAVYANQFVPTAQALLEVNIVIREYLGLLGLVFNI